MSCLVTGTRVALLCLTLLCSRPPIQAQDVQPLPDLKKTKAIKVTYLEGQQPRVVTITDQKELEPLLRDLEIKEIDKARHLEARPLSLVEFTLSDDKAVELYFAGERNRLQGYKVRYGLIYLDAKFCEKLNEMLTKKAGRTIDLLKQN